jgi:hypothetical protein
MNKFELDQQVDGQSEIGERQQIHTSSGFEVSPMQYNLHEYSIVGL